MDSIWVIAFGAGIISFLSPCVLPLVPPYLSYMAGVSLEQMTAMDRSRTVHHRIMITAILFVLGFSTVFVLLGATASVFGALVRAYLPLLGQLAGLVIILMGLHFIGIFQFSILHREWRPHVQKPASLWGAYVMGLAFAFGWTPCIGPVLGTILAKAANDATLSQGALLLGVYAAGLGLPFMLTAGLTQPFARFMVPFKKQARLIERIMGVLLVITGIAFLSDGFSRLSYWLLESFPLLGKLG
jgi:cytochrome c-type biogenesis protein